MKIVFDPEIPEDLREEIKKLIEEENVEVECPECKSKEKYVALLEKVLDVKCYDCGHSFIEIEMEEE